MSSPIASLPLSDSDLADFFDVPLRDIHRWKSELAGSLGRPESSIQHTMRVCRPSPPISSLAICPTAAGLLTSQQVAMLIGVSFRSVKRWRRLGLLPKPVRLGSRIRYTEASIRQWVQCGGTQGYSTSRRRMSLAV